MKFVNDVFLSALTKYLEFSKNDLKLSFPFKVVFGLVHVKDFKISVASKLKGNICKEEIILEDTIELLDINISKIVKFFIEKVRNLACSQEC